VLVTLCAGPAAPAAETPNPLDKAPSRFAKLDDHRIHYKSRGEGKTALVFVHGWTADMNCWRYQVPAFDGKIRLILIDLPGHGRSDKPKIEYTMALFAHAINAVLTDAGVDKAALAGHSMGTPVVRQFYRLYPEKTAALVAVDGFLRMFITKPEDIDRFVGRFSGPDFKENYGKFIESMFTPQTSPDLRKEIRAMLPTAPQYVAVSAMKAMFDPAIWKDDEIKVPVQVIMAPRGLVSADYEKYVHNLAPQLDYRVMDGVGHLLMLEKPQEFNDLLSGFLKKQGLLP
jgi:pimeloyl-ACP methyl ester carboxylesterase